MILKKLVIENIGPFATPTAIDVSDQVTTLTGRNDTGKSTLLRIIGLILGSGAIDEDLVNRERFRIATVAWQEDLEIKCTATFRLTDKLDYFSNVKPPFENGGEVDIMFNLAPKVLKSSIIGARKPNGTNRSRSGRISHLPKVLSLNDLSDVGSTIDLENLNPAEKTLMSVAFGENPQDKLSELSEANLVTNIRLGAAILTDKLRELTSQSLGLQFLLDLVPGAEPNKIVLSIRDHIGADTLITMRGSGIRKITKIMAFLMQVTDTNDQICILIDEPENSLHADAQHMLRVFLERISKSARIQVIFATHSPSMINRINLNGLRLLKQKSIEGKPSIEVDNSPYGDNFLGIRSSLGLTAVDSLLYGPVTVIVDGKTEIPSMNYLFEKIRQENELEDFNDLDELLELTQFLNGEGSSFAFWCRIAKAQGSRPVIFVDGDMDRRLLQKRFKNECGDVPVIVLDEGTEFEDIVTPEIYFESINKVYKGHLGASSSYEDFRSWELPLELNEKMLFSKRVKKWLREIHDISIDKPEVMREALTIADIEDLNLKQVKLLLEAIRLEVEKL